jgi:DNA-binding response OmpR family regulator
MNTPEQTRRILLVEDHVSESQAIKETFELLRSFRYEVTVAGSVQEVCEKQWENAHWDAMIVDLGLLDRFTEEYSGFYLVPRVQHARTLTIVYTAHAEPKTLARSVLLGADLFVDKDYEPSELVEIVDIIFREYERRREQDQRMRPVLERRGAQWQREHAGKSIAIIGEQVVAAESTRLKLAVAFDKYVQANSGVTESPYIIDMLKDNTQ